MAKQRNRQIFPSDQYPSPRLTEEAVHEIAEELKPTKPLPVTKLRPTLVQEIKDAKYKNLTIDLSVARAQATPLQLRSLGIVGDTMTVIRADAAFNYILNDPTNDPTPAVAGMAENQMEIEEIYITNAAAAPGSIAIIRVNYNPFLIRIR